jgi:hypothetical protein
MRAGSFSGCLRHCVRCGTLSEMDSAKVASVIYIPRTKAAPLAWFGLRDDLGAVPPGGKGRPSSLLLARLL